jgi:hypothetical protein
VRGFHARAKIGRWGHYLNYRTIIV